MLEPLLPNDEQLNPTTPFISDEQLLELQKIDNLIDSLYARRTEIAKEVLKSAYKVSTHVNVGGEKPWMRVTLTDNLHVFDKEDAVHRVATINRYEVKIDYLKNEPKEK